MIIIGAGMSGLLCGALNHGSVIYEAGEEKYINHKALFRCRTDKVGVALGIPFKKVQVQKAIWMHGQECKPSIRAAHLYAKKVTGNITSRSILNIDNCERYIAPDNFVDQLKDRCKILWSTKVSKIDRISDPIVSTAPLFTNIELCGMDSMNLTAKAVSVSRFRIKNCDAYCTMYYPDPDNMSVYRASLTGDTLITEGIRPITKGELLEVCSSLGVDCIKSDILDIKCHTQPLGKIEHIPNQAREQAILEMTLTHNLYSLGRFATWRPKVMLDDVLEDIYHIQRLIIGGKYAALKHKQHEVN